MKASDIMTIGTITVHPDSTVTHAARVMIERGVSGLPVVSAHGKLVGMITEGDLLRRKELGTAGDTARWLDFWLSEDKLARNYAREHGHKVEDVMSRDVASIGPDEPIGKIVELLEAKGIKRVPVVRDGQVVGMVSRANLLSALARLAGETPQPVLDDLAIRKSIADELAGKAWAPGATINIAVRNGVVTLSGTVETGHVKDAVRVAAENAPGVVRVWDNIRAVDTL
jgi:CBS domain-containing protein